jgi:hypothetical protein
MAWNHSYSSMDVPSWSRHSISFGSFQCHYYYYSPLSFLLIFSDVSLALLLKFISKCFPQFTCLWGWGFIPHSSIFPFEQWEAFSPSGNKSIPRPGARPFQLSQIFAGFRIFDWLNPAPCWTRPLSPYRVTSTAPCQMTFSDEQKFIPNKTFHLPAS